MEKYFLTKPNSENEQVCPFSGEKKARKYVENVNGQLPVVLIHLRNSAHMHLTNNTYQTPQSQAFLHHRDLTHLGHM